MDVFILGSGIMAVGIAIDTAKHGHRTTLWHRTDASKAENAVWQKLNHDLQLNRLSINEYDLIRTNIRTSGYITECSKADIIIESVIENLKIKSELLAKAEKYIQPQTIICTNTSSFSIDSLAADLSRKSRFIGLHFFNPVDRMNLVEIVKGSETSEQTVETAGAFVKSIGKEYVLLGNSPGFIVNRLLLSYLNNAVNLLQSGIACKEDIDRAMKLGANHPLGPFALCDLIGVDTVYHILLSLHEQLKEDIYRPNALFGEMVKQGRLGKKTGEGFYKY